MVGQEGVSGHGGAPPVYGGVPPQVATAMPSPVKCTNYLKMCGSFRTNLSPLLADSFQSGGWIGQVGLGGYKYLLEGRA